MCLGEVLVNLLSRRCFAAACVFKLKKTTLRQGQIALSDGFDLQSNVHQAFADLHMSTTVVRGGSILGALTDADVTSRAPERYR